MKRFILIAAMLVTTAVGSVLFAQETQSESTSSVTAAANTAQWKYIAAALAVGIACIAGGIAVGQIGAAAMGAMSENPELSGKALPYAGLAEGICLWGFLVALFILLM
ncbi:MAG TPA: ATP synthase subunit C [Treponema sp.]|jgi:V/A-type H+-transporting ATPase subunit K|uniref:ATP synthase subunit C n=1 Tax=Gracilinema caldarium TaxID=215591 RepID=UPI0026E9BD8E|nr:ATP synthase subunit C [Gracilinema caldarium]HON13027.1 ATP synthase subunit C [Treponema sp.]HPC71616.1 ATP synthase subunit C [Treponema sp.]HRS03596.1 ATP synthase subunit C [Treponema sp.]HRU28326.1 ATP synthase subunit C [Treponema sp.]